MHSTPAPLSRRGFIAGAGGAAAALLLAACSSPAAKPSASGSKGPFSGKIFIQNPAALSQTPYLVAREMGAFAAAKMTLSEIALAPAAMPSGLVSKSADFALTAVASNILPLAAQGIAPICVAKVYTNNPNSIIVSEKYMKKVGISVTSSVHDRLEALKGARFGASDPGTGTDVSVQFAMLDVKARLGKDYTMTYLHDIGTFLSAMQTDQIDAFAVSSPIGEQAEVAGFGKVYLNLGAGEVKGLAGMPWTSLWMLKEQAEANPDMVVATIRGLKKGLALLDDKPAKAESDVRSLFTSTADAAFAPAWKNNLKAYDLDPSFDSDSFQKSIDFYNFTKTGADLITAAPDTFYTNEYVKAAA